MELTTDTTVRFKSILKIKSARIAFPSFVKSNHTVFQPPALDPLPGCEEVPGSSHSCPRTAKLGEAVLAGFVCF